VDGFVCESSAVHRLPSIVLKMSILKNFVNPWESTGEFGSQALGTEVLEGNVIETSKPDEVITADIADERTDLGKGNLMLLFGATIKTYQEAFSKENLESNNELWDYFVTYQNLYEVLDRVKEYQTKYSNILLQNVVIYSHGSKNTINIEYTSLSKKWLFGKNVLSYINGNLNIESPEYKAIKLLEFIGEIMSDGGNIVFLACSSGYEEGKKLTEKQKRDGDVSIELGKFYSSQGKSLNLFFNKDLTYFGKDRTKTDLLGVPWGEGLSSPNTGWRFIQTNPNNEELNITILDNDLTIVKESIYDEPPHYDLIKPI